MYVCVRVLLRALRRLSASVSEMGMGRGEVNVIEYGWIVALWASLRV